MSKFERNPFQRSALKDTELLAGRISELKQIRFILRNAAFSDKSFRHLLIAGKRGVGKTSFLNIIQNECEFNNIIPIRINLTESISKNSNEFFWNIFNQTINKFFGLGFFGGKNGPVDTAIQNILYSDGSSDNANWVFRTPLLRKKYIENDLILFDFTVFINDLNKIYKEIVESKMENFNSKTKIVFLIDETQNIYNNKKIVEELRYIIQEQDIGIGFVFAGDSKYQSLIWEEVFGGTHRDFDILNLDYFETSSSVEDYFKKSLLSIGWTENEIEKTMFYRFHKACANIFTLTSGRPAFINIIAHKMFDRCMIGDSATMNFDRQARDDVKELLVESGDLNFQIIDFIDELPKRETKWLSMIFDCELSTLDMVYFYGKFLFIEPNFFSKNEFRAFCNFLIEKKILVLIQDVEKKAIGYKTQSEENDILYKRYVAFGMEFDTIKQWLQINSDGEFGFSAKLPEFYFMKQINKFFVKEEYNLAMISARVADGENNYDVTEIINKVNQNLFNINDENFTFIKYVYKLFKRLNSSQEKQLIRVELKKEKSQTTRTWIAYNYNEKGRIIGFEKSEKLLEKLKSNVEKFNNDEEIFSLNIHINNLTVPNIKNFQKAIMESKDNKKIGILIDDKIDDLSEYYIKDKDKKSSYEIAQFFNELYLNGHDLEFNVLNNSGYVFLENDELDIADSLFKESKRKIERNSSDVKNYENLILVSYNSAILNLKKNEFELAIKGFNLVIEIINANDKINDSVAAILLLELNEEYEIIFYEAIEGDEKYSKISLHDFSINNIKIIEEYTQKDLK